MKVARLSIAPVRSLGLQHPEAIDLTADGVAEDRRFFLVDDRGFLVDRVVVGSLAQVGAWTDPDGLHLRLTFPDGRRIDGPIKLGEPIEADVHGRAAAGRVVVGPWAQAIEPFAGGRRLRLVRCDRIGGTRLRGTNGVSLVSDASLRRLAAALGVDHLDARRFRMLIELEGATEANEEDEWIGGEIAIGTAVLRITKPDARCAITTQDPDLGHRDLDTLRAIRSYRGIRMGESGPKLDFGVLGDVLTAGRIALGDEVRVLRRGDMTYERRVPVSAATGDAG